MSQENIIEKINKKYQEIGENPDTYLNGLLQAKPINYWDYIEVETLLSLQRPRTDFKDEEIFILYHQVTELMLKLMVHEIKQILEEDSLTEEFLMSKFSRLNRYTEMLINSFDIMKDGMDYDDYNTFRATLAPASGFQSVQFRYIELYCTQLENLINDEGKKRIGDNPTVEDYFEHIYWKDAGMNRKTGKKTLTLKQFEDKYLDGLISLAKKMKGKTIQDRLQDIESPSEELQNKLREFDHLYNVAWPLVHLQTAQHYLDKKGENKAATGGSEWKKYLHPKFQQRKFFPNLWTDNEKTNWGD
ncbi:tryptophan 2,3-dioxygenase family protein [Acidiluteibacter ferrifornacis]|uniref:Tryptophan 2,3-dioxygenase n=1 Tax=Acidiluteibacter ferrifornacis TaxID=2692424 RepID=A0A6N9NGA7_9FLAO|nr:tryptophan 2,3-dioxygenase family protein [Acidiluteibacter ferrifornacis]NBG65668.1 tryptophan 2,3-dioxygenase [Acidiluteibacter ferrifornacis]